jgi:TorA maturation chaperone TorD
LERVEKTKIRVIYYTLFSRLLTREVDEQTIDIIKSGCATDELMSDMFRLTTEWEDFKTKTSLEIAEILASEYVDLFILKLVPYESFYTSENKMIESGSDNKTNTFYKQYGFEADLIAARVVSGDHIGIELEFMMSLIKHELEALENNDIEYADKIRSIQKDFLNKHLLPFAFHLLPALASASKTPFYKDIGEVALEFVLSDFEELNK